MNTEPKPLLSYSTQIKLTYVMQACSGLLIFFILQQIHQDTTVYQNNSPFWFVFHFALLNVNIYLLYWQFYVRRKLRYALLKALIDDAQQQTERFRSRDTNR